MGLQLPKFASELEEADWWYDHRDLVEAEFIVLGATGKLQQRISATGEYVAAPAWKVTADELKDARAVLEASGIWIEDKSYRPSLDELPAQELRKAS